MSLPQLDLKDYAGPIATITTSLGTIKVALFPKQAPKTVENFIGLIKKGYYDGQVFHRIIPDFMIQGGDPTGTGMGGESIWGESFEDEFSPELFNIRGALSMANAGPNTNGSQFFIVSNEHIRQDMLDQMPDAGYPQEIIDAYQNGGTPWLDQRHTVFGQVISGMNVLDAISQVKTDGADKPVESVLVESITVENAD
ncbi:peptidylprolyl isomerase [Lacticaseibacillus brantae]|uniref:Peptidyl-prolyl cis-trans isomerase n=1 Tax=Lacticaseibacillus brantae DSM 23927 TaxID=1423727 RepID=A0A0R2B9I7_9LACO|nr:peptidylprolyl isomerase [Lacticaseibacillus brantae]KRM72259.1 peptidyl-prolyl isomerase [Lacticaseibacillus brantae DSM 23927]